MLTKKLYSAIKKKKTVNTWYNVKNSKLLLWEQMKANEKGVQIVLLYIDS